MTKINFVNGQAPALNDVTLNQLQTNIENAISEAIAQAILEDNKKKYYVGKIVMDTANVNPATYLGFGTWQYWGQGRVPVGVDTTDSDFNSVEKTGGEKKHTMTEAEMYKHKHNVGIYINNSSAGDQVYWFNPGGFASENTSSSNSTKVSEVGQSQPFNIQQKYITCYMWKRVA